MRRSLVLIVTVVCVALILAATALAQTPTPAPDEAGMPAAPSAADVIEGASLVRQYTCLYCHSVDGSPGIGPTWAGLYNSRVTLADGTTVVANEDYIIQSIVSPNAQIVQGYQPNVMPAFGAYLNLDQVEDMVAFIISLGEVVPAATAAPTEPMVPAASPTPAKVGTVVLVAPTPAADVPGIALPADAAPEVMVEDQEVIGGTVIIQRVVSPGYGWMAIHADSNGSPGDVIGQAPVWPGLNIDVAVTLRADQITPTLHAMLHIDAGQQRTYEFPGPDVPVVVGDQSLTVPFQVTVVTPAEPVEEMAPVPPMTPEPLGTAPAATPPGGTPGAAMPTGAPGPGGTAPAATPAGGTPEAAASPAATPQAMAGDPQAGEQLVAQLGCTGCHSTDGSPGTGPTWQGLFGSTVPLADGSTVTADEAYITHSIQDPYAQIVQGFPPTIRTNFGQSLNDEQIADLVAYISTLR